MSKNNLNNHLTESTKQSIYKILEEGPTAQRNLQQFRERMARNREERAKRAEERRNNPNWKPSRVQNTIGGESQRTETTGVSRMARGLDGRPVSRYVNPNSPEGRIDASIAGGNEPDLQRDPTTGRLDPTRSAGRLARDATAAGQAAFDKSIGFNTTGLSQTDIRNRVRERVVQKTAEMKTEIDNSIPKPVVAQPATRPVAQPTSDIPPLLQRDESMPKFEPKNSGQITVPITPRPSTGTPPPHGGRPTPGMPKVNIPKY